MSETPKLPKFDNVPKIDLPKISNPPLVSIPKELEVKKSPSPTIVDELERIFKKLEEIEKKIDALKK